MRKAKLVIHSYFVHTFLTKSISLRKKIIKYYNLNFWPIRCTDMTMTSNMMKVLHIPLLRPTCTLSSTAGNNICTNSGAGVYVNNNGEDIIGIQSRVYRPDMRKLVANHGSPKFTINIDKTPTVVGARSNIMGALVT